MFSQDSQEYLYTESNGEITITKYLGPAVSVLSIPGVIDGKPVTQIADSIFIREGTPANGAPVLNVFKFTELKK